MNTSSDPKNPAHVPAGGRAEVKPHALRRVAGSACAAALSAVLGAGCLQGPWDYTPERVLPYKGIHTTAYLVAGKPVADVCFEAFIPLSQGWTNARPFYRDAEVLVEGPFSDGSSSLTLTPRVPWLPSPLTNSSNASPNCFEGPADALPQPGETYSLRARFTWDSLGTEIESRFTATTTIPSGFSTKDSAAAPSLATLGIGGDGLLDPDLFARLPEGPRTALLEAYPEEFATLIALQGDSAALAAYIEENRQTIVEASELLQDSLQGDLIHYAEGDTLFFMRGGSAIENLSHYVGVNFDSGTTAVLLSHRWDTLGNRVTISFDEIFGIKTDTVEQYYPGNIHRLVLYPSVEQPGGGNILDSIGLVNAWFFTGLNRFYFHAFGLDYWRYNTTATQDPNPSVPRFTNIEGGAGIFAGAALDSFDINIKADPDAELWPQPIAKGLSCGSDGWWSTRECRAYETIFCRMRGWSGEDCRVQARRDCLWEPAGDTRPSDSICAAVDSTAEADEGFRDEVEIQACIEVGFEQSLPDLNRSCSAWKETCLEGEPGNACRKKLIRRCELDFWQGDLCEAVRPRYCAETDKPAAPLCREL